MLIDLVKHGYLLKFNKIKSETFESYHASLIADTILSRCRHNISMLMRTPFKISYRGAYSFSHIPSRRLGFIPSPFVTLLICSLPRIRSKLSLELFISALVIWVSLVMLKIASSVFLLAYSIKRVDTIHNLDPSFSKIGPL
ncbi:uncharacterized protein BEWA_019900 [Theileria equi strain WA]|uniref:Membrane protein, putative n=1 Tax=Theileria equi strain WA TaxID=1537102 RepID=L0AW66_THEEQ|nr:uncharacterized protein BEWA_019900 [Theileria equi strain WA]AFZ79144.1 membrane protein, putative [Theileria equi strain WA]|eukprot:XP_004828810.1 uncharacterized protein BEWA_019900 [Theileria equi strain WA]